ncbi:hypothetical protein [Fulvivirga imtechensis]|nr:hypothetical protein [Fulvivirga imtechensis]
MSKDKEIRFVGQPILKQIMKLIDAVNIQGLINKHQSDHEKSQEMDRVIRRMTRELEGSPESKDLR